MSTLVDLREGESGTIIKVRGRGAFRKRITEMGFVRGKEVTVVKAAPLQDPIEYKIMGYNVSLRKTESALIEVFTEDEARHQQEVLDIIAGIQRAPFRRASEEYSRGEEQDHRRRPCRATRTAGRPPFSTMPPDRTSMSGIFRRRNRRFQDGHLPTGRVPLSTSPTFPGPIRFRPIRRRNCLCGTTSSPNPGCCRERRGCFQSRTESVPHHTADRHGHPCRDRPEHV